MVSYCLVLVWVDFLSSRLAHFHVLLGAGVLLSTQDTQRGIVDTASTSFSLMCRFHTYFRRHTRRATAGSENPARAMEASLALVRRAPMEDLRDHYMINRRYDPSPEVINLSHSIGSLSTTQDHPCRPWPTFLRLNVLSQMAWTSVRIQAGSITINIY